MLSILTFDTLQLGRFFAFLRLKTMNDMSDIRPSDECVVRALSLHIVETAVTTTTHHEFKTALHSLTGQCFAQTAESVVWTSYPLYREKNIITFTPKDIIVIYVA